MAFDRESELGGLWSRQGRNGEFLSGKLKLPDGSEMEIVVFPNTFKQEGERTPDWRIYRSQPREDQAQASQPRPRPSAPTPRRESHDDEPDLDDAIPF